MYIDNPNLTQAMTKESVNSGTMREIFFINMLEMDHEIALHKQGDFAIDHQYIVEVGGNKKDYNSTL